MLITMWSHLLRSLSSTVATVVVVGIFLSPSWTKLDGYTFGRKGSLQNFNKSVNQDMHKERWLKEIERKVNRNGQGQRTTLKEKTRIELAKPLDTTGLRQLNFTGRDNPYDIKDIITSTKGPPAVLIHPHTIEKNIISFPMSRDNFGNKTLVTRVNLFVFIWKPEPSGNKKVSSSSSSSPLLATTKPGKPGFTISTRELKKRARRRSRKRRNRMIKIRVFLVDHRGTRGRRIAELKKRVSGSEWQRIGLPVSLFKSVIETSTNSTLRLRVECRRCTRKTQLILPGNGKSRRCHRKGRSKRKDRKSKRTSRKRGRRLRKKCSRVLPEGERKKKTPFIVIEDKRRSSRPKRSSTDTTQPGCRQDSNTRLSKFFQASHPLQNKTHISEPTEQSCCKMLTTYVSFSELDLDNIVVYPSGFPLVTCVGTCVEETPTSSSSFTHTSNHKSQNLLHRLLHGDIAGDRLSQPHRSVSSTHAHSLHVKTNATIGPSSEIVQKRNRLKKLRHCMPTKTSGLSIVYLAHDNNLFQTEIPNVLITDCGCNSHHATTT